MMTMDRTINATAVTLATSAVITALFPPAGAAAVLTSLAWRIGVPALLGSALVLDTKDQVQLALLRRKVSQMEEALREKSDDVVIAEEVAGEP